MKKHISNILSCVRLFSPLVLIPLIISGNYLMAFMSLATFLGIDVLNGFLTHRWHVESDLGTKIDVVADKTILLSLLIPLMMKNHLFIVSGVLEVIISSTNVIRKIKGYSPKTLQIGHVKMVLNSLLIGISYLEIFVTIPIVISNILFSITTLFQGLTEYSYLQEFSLENRKRKMEKRFVEITKKRDEKSNDDKTDCKKKDMDRKEELMRLREDLLQSIKEKKDYKKSKKL